MGTVIRATAVHTEPAPIASISCSARAATRCLESAGLRGSDVDLLISTGVYRERNLAEPALAALIQRELGANPDPVLDGRGSRTFSFDLMNGPVGILNAVQVAGAMLANGRYRNVLVVSNDVHPSVQPAPGFPFAQVGTAVLLGRSAEAERGFRSLAFRTTACTDPGFRGVISLAEDRGGRAARDYVRIEVEPRYFGRLREFTVSTVRDHLRERASEGREITHLVCSRPTVSFAEEVAGALHLSPDVAVCDGVEGDAHSSYLAAAYHAAQARKAFATGDTILFVGAGAGLSCGCGLYQV
jgi:3-oxoacyl-[acyl-carrier-protein] synthase-3